ncbi:MAG: hypothetical protein COB01_02005 [Lutibacter sp.]|nr:MAG: hypothetical protein COB01_02005 [Lutibacter sp.]
MIKTFPFKSNKTINSRKKAMKRYAKDTLNIPTLVAITNPNNVASGKLLEKLGFKFDTLINLAEDGKDVCKLFIQKAT